MDEFARFRAWGRVGGLRAWARNDPDTMVGPAHRGFRARFEREVLEAAEKRGEQLTERELATRADRARRAHMLALAAKSAASRKRKATAEGQNPAAAKPGAHADGLPAA